ncbi:Zonadhesin [Drechslerella dactyloides]|uniref:Zonadhesin n=1 Tax=Drechslerella dactyloides TaxID=74499 RepID=A0AAD6J3I6_DREDA|nr:Zonadhesin [Drechslerella dactyloides]
MGKRHKHKHNARHKHHHEAHVQAPHSAKSTDVNNHPADKSAEHARIEVVEYHAERGNSSDDSPVETTRAIAVQPLVSAKEIPVDEEIAESEPIIAVSPETIPQIPAREASVLEKFVEETIEAAAAESVEGPVQHLDDEDIEVTPVKEIIDLEPVEETIEQDLPNETIDQKPIREIIEQSAKPSDEEAVREILEETAKEIALEEALENAGIDVAEEPAETLPEVLPRVLPEVPAQVPADVPVEVLVEASIEASAGEPVDKVADEISMNIPGAWESELLENAPLYEPTEQLLQTAKEEREREPEPELSIEMTEPVAELPTQEPAPVQQLAATEEAHAEELPAEPLVKPELEIKTESTTPLAPSIDESPVEIFAPQPESEFIPPQPLFDEPPVKENIIKEPVVEVPAEEPSTSVLNVPSSQLIDESPLGTPIFAEPLKKVSSAPEPIIPTLLDEPVDIAQVHIPALEPIHTPTTPTAYPLMKDHSPSVSQARLAPAILTPPIEASAQKPTSTEREGQQPSPATAATGSLWKRQIGGQSMKLGKEGGEKSSRRASQLNIDEKKAPGTLKTWWNRMIGAFK